MDNILKQRLIGALILVALGVVFWPIIFVEPDIKPLGETRYMPDRPAVDTTPIEPPSSVGLRPSPVIQVQEQQEAEVREELDPAEVPVRAKPNLAPKSKPAALAPPYQKTRSEAPVKPAIDADGVPIGWILQIASISNAAKAEEMRKSLIGMGYKAYVKKIKSGNSVLLRVYVGPKFERSRLEAMQPKIDAEFKVKSMVRRYIP